MFEPADAVRWQVRAVLRSAVRNFPHGRLSEAVAVCLENRKTATVYGRYRVVDEAGCREALAKVEREMTRDQARTAVP